MMTFQIVCSKIDFVEKNAEFVFLMKAPVTQKIVNLYKSFFVNYVRASVGNS